MRSHKLFLVGATLLATTSATGLSFADPPVVMTPTNPSVPAPMPPPNAPPPAASSTTTTSTTTTTAGELALPPPTTTTAPPRESITVYERIRPNRPLLITGSLALIGTYGATAIVNGVNGSEGDHDLYIPVVGPWINLAERTCSGDCADHKRDTVLIAASGILQSVGAVMVITSFLIPEKVATAKILAGPVKMQVTPTAASGGGGVAAFGTF